MRRLKAMKKIVICGSLSVKKIRNKQRHPELQMPHLWGDKSKLRNHNGCVPKRRDIKRYWGISTCNPTIIAAQKAAHCFFLRQLEVLPLSKKVASNGSLRLGPKPRRIFLDGSCSPGRGSLSASLTVQRYNQYLPPPYFDRNKCLLLDYSDSLSHVQPTDCPLRLFLPPISRLILRRELHLLEAHLA